MQQQQQMRAPGYMIVAVLVAAGLSPVPPSEYLEALDRLARLCKVQGRYKRPQAGTSHDVAEATNLGQFSNVPPEQRRVAEERDCWAHVREATTSAKAKFFPEKEAGRVWAIIEEAAERALERTRAGEGNTPGSAYATPGELARGCAVRAAALGEGKGRGTCPST